MTTPTGPIPLGAERVSGGNYRATYSVQPGTRVHLLITPEAYAAGDLAIIRDRVAEWFPTQIGPGETIPET